MNVEDDARAAGVCVRQPDEGEGLLAIEQDDKGDHLRPKLRTETEGHASVDHVPRDQKGSHAEAYPTYWKGGR